MKYLLRSILLVAVWFAFAVNGTTQQYQGIKGKSDFSIKVNFKDLVELDKLLPAQKTKGRQIKNEFEKHPDLPINTDKVIFRESVKPQYYNPSFKEDSPLPDMDFLALKDNNTSIPPDVNGAVGPNHLMVTLNTEIRIMDRDGNTISTIGTGAFWTEIPGGSGTFDPKISYDPYANRWILIMPSGSTTTSSWLFVAVSENQDPTGNWYMYRFDTDPDNQHWFDYPNYGFNKNWIICSGNMFGNSFGYSVLFVLNKEDLYNNAYEIRFTRFAINDGFTLVPAVTYDPDEEDVYMVNNAGGNNNGNGYLNLWKVTGDVDEPEVMNLGLIEIPDPWSNGSYANGGNFAPQLGSDEKINTVDARMENMVFRNGKLWCVHHIYLPAENPNRCSVQWFELSTDGTILQRGRIDDPSGLMYYAFATIAVNAKEDIMVGFASFSEEQYASGSYAFRHADDPQNVMRNPYQFIDGLSPYYKTYGAERNRWGDYTATWVDPVDDLDFWTIQEYADLPGSQDQWSTWWAMVDVHAVPAPDFTSNISFVPTGSGVNFMDLSKYNPTDWQWTFQGGTPATSTEQNPQNIIYETEGLFDVTLTASNSMGSETIVMEDYINSNTEILPEVDFSISDTVPCLENTVMLHDLTIYNPNSWLWSFYPNVVTFVNGTDQFSQNPEVIFDLPLTYDITLSATNNNGSASITKTASLHAGGMALPFSDNFETRSFLSKGWTVENPDDEITWEITTVGGNEPGNLAAWVNIKAYPGYEERDRLISPPINLRDYRDVVLEFEYAYAQRFPQYTDSLLVYISDDCGSNWTRILSLGQDSLGGFATSEPSTNNFIPESPEDWCGSEGNPECVQIDLSEWDYTPNVRIMFETYNGFGNNLYLDNVNIDGTLSGISENTNTIGELFVYPNPSNGLVTLSAQNMAGKINLRVIDLSGKTVYNDEFINTSGILQKSFDLTDLNNGIYIIELQYYQKSIVQKLVIR
ncbi:MAG: PKD domain-containing protein [Bacteroidales bacterium]|nr:PKD domain-containing protein [Bacteroidales bacterium]